MQLHDNSLTYKSYIVAFFYKPFLYCCSHIEGEFHFLTKCPTYKNLRHTLFDEIKATIMAFYYPPNAHFLFWFCSTIMLPHI